jgi:hypothetical protein
LNAMNPNIEVNAVILCFERKQIAIADQTVVRFKIRVRTAIMLPMVVYRWCEVPLLILSDAAWWYRPTGNLS